MMEPYRIILADDHILLRNSMRISIEKFPDLQVIGEVSDGKELLKFLTTTQPDLIILDISMPHLPGIEAAQEIKKNFPRIKILILTMHKSKDYLRSALATGVEGYLLKENAYDDLITAIRDLQQGKIYISPLVMNQIKEIIQAKTDGPGAGSSDLTTREVVILKLMAEIEQRDRRSTLYQRAHGEPAPLQYQAKIGLKDQCRSDQICPGKRL